jgi:nitroreductase
MIHNETLNIIKQRRSIRSYKDGQISDEQLQAVLEAGLYTPNAGGQVWHFTAVQNRDMLSRLNAAAKQAARQSDMEWLKDLGGDEHFDCLYGAPALVIISGDSRSPVPLDSDCAAAAQNMLLAAESLGLGSCWIYFVLMAFDSPEGNELRGELKIPEGYRPYCSAVLGYKQGEAPAAPERKSGLITYIK